MIQINPAVAVVQGGRSPLADALNDTVRNGEIPVVDFSVLRQDYTIIKQEFGHNASFL